jgi:hypothetical protein
MRKTIASLVVAAGLVATPLAARADSPGAEVGYSALAAVSNIFYTPAKVVVAMVGFVAGGAAGTLNGGDTRAAYAFWVPMIGGNWFLTSDQMDGRQPVEFFGSDYTDRPSTYERTHQGCAAYDATYKKMR